MRWLRLARATSDARLPQPYECQLPGVAMNSRFRPEPAVGEIPTGSRFRLVTAVQVRKTNDCCYRKQSLHQDFREGQLYPLKLTVESDHCQVTALPCADLVLSTQSRRWHGLFGCLL